MNRQRLMYGDWLVESDEDRLLRELGEAYHLECNAYDRNVCSGTSPRTGEPIPVTPFEQGLINQYSREVRFSAIRQGRELGFTDEQVSDAIKKAAR